jgi:hypothetical protein
VEEIMTGELTEQQKSELAEMERLMNEAYEAQRIANEAREIAWKKSEEAANYARWIWQGAKDKEDGRDTDAHSQREAKADRRRGSR